MTMVSAFDPRELEMKVKAMYRSVAEDPHGEFHFEMGRKLAERLGYAPSDLDRIPAESIEFIRRRRILFPSCRSEGRRDGCRSRQRFGHGHVHCRC